MLRIELTSQFKKDYKLAKKRGYDLSLLKTVLETLMMEKTLEPKYRDHALTGNMSKFRECHIQPDWLLVYRRDQDRLVLVGHRTGTHADLFGK